MKTKSTSPNQPYSSVLELIKAQPTLSNMVAASGNIKLIDQTIIKVIDAALAKQVKTVGLKNGVIFIQCHSASVATKMRFENNRLIEAVKQHQALAHCFNIQYRVKAIECNDNNRQTSTSKSKIKKATISNYSKRTISKTADTIKDEALKKALMRLID